MTWAKRMMLVDAISESGVGIRTTGENIILPIELLFINSI